MVLLISPPEWNVIEELARYAKDNIYNDKNVKILESIFQKLFIKAILEEQFGLAKLLKWNDGDLQEELISFQEVIDLDEGLWNEDRDVNLEPQASEYFDFSVPIDYNNAKILWQVEGRVKSIGKYLINELDRSLQNKVIKDTYLDSLSSPNVITGCMSCFDDSNIKRFLVEISRYTDHFNLYGSKYKKQIAQIIWGKTSVDIDYERLEGVTESISDYLKDKEDFNFTGLVDATVKSIQPEGVVKKLRGAERSEFTNLMLTNLFSEFEAPENILKKALLSNENGLLNNKEEMLTSCGYNTSKDFLSDVDETLSSRAPSDNLEEGIIKEFVKYLEKILEEKIREDQVKKWVFPSTKNKVGEIDVWVLYVFKNRRPKLELIECSINTSEEKELSDRSKLKQHRNQVKKKFDKKIEVELFFNEKSVSN